jgi:hypothetical protein
LAEAEATKVKTIIYAPFSSQKIIDCDITIESLKDGLKRLNALKTQLF